MATDPLMVLSPEMEAQQLLDDAAAVTARELMTGIASLAYAVGMGVAPHPDACRAAADRMVKKFGGAVLAAIEFERHIADLGCPVEGLPLAEIVADADRLADSVDSGRRTDAASIVDTLRRLTKYARRGLPAILPGADGSGAGDDANRHHAATIERHGGAVQ